MYVTASTSFIEGVHSFHSNCQKGAMTLKRLGTTDLYKDYYLYSYLCKKNFSIFAVATKHLFWA